MMIKSQKLKMIINIKVISLLALFFSIMVGMTNRANANLPDQRTNTAARNDTPGIVYINIRGNVIAPPPCKINNGNTIDVDFAEIMSTHIDGIEYKKTINFSLDCKKMPTNALYLSIESEPSDFDNRYLKTNIKGLGIALFINGEKFNRGEVWGFDYYDLPKFEAVPVRNLSENLSGGYFESSATLKIDYQ